MTAGASSRVMDAEEPSDSSGDFRIEALYAALDERRRRRGMSWPQVAREMNAAISPSTLSGMRARSALEGDGVLQMLRWLERAPESFVEGIPQNLLRGATLPATGARQILRFDTRSLYSALDARRIERGMTWQQVAGKIRGSTAGGLSRLSKGGRTTFPQVMRMTRWLGRPVAAFTRASDR